MKSSNSYSGVPYNIPLRVFIVFECYCYNHPTRKFHLKNWLNQPSQLKVLRCFVSIPIYSSALSVLCFLLIYIACTKEVTSVPLLLMWLTASMVFVSVLIKCVFKFALLQQIPTRGRLIVCVLGLGAIWY